MNIEKDSVLLLLIALIIANIFKNLSFMNKVHLLHTISFGCSQLFDIPAQYGGFLGHGICILFMEMPTNVQQPSINIVLFKLFVVSDSSILSLDSKILSFSEFMKDRENLYNFLLETFQVQSRRQMHISEEHLHI